MLNFKRIGTHIDVMYPTYNEFPTLYFKQQQGNWEHTNAMGGFESERPRYDLYFNMYNVGWLDYQYRSYSYRYPVDNFNITPNFLFSMSHLTITTQGSLLRT